MIPDYPNPLCNSEPFIQTGFNPTGYEAFMRDHFTIVDKEKQEVPFVANPAQQSMNHWMERYFNLLILKSRKMGFSSDALGIATAKFITGRNEKCVSMSFDQEASDKQLSRAKHFIRSYEMHNNIKVPLKYNSKTEMVWEGVDPKTKRPFMNTLRVGTARNTSFGRGDDITFLHLTEVSLCDVPLLLAGVGEACIASAHKILETTAAGFNEYKKFWDRTVLNETGFAALFYSPFWEYDEAYIEEKRKILGKLFDQEFPFTPQLAFLTSGDPYFDSEAMRWYLDQVERRQQVYA